MVWSLGSYGFRGRRGTLAAVCVVLAGVLPACTPIVNSHGYTPADDQLAAIVVGTDTRDTVAEKIGQPFNVGVGQARAWYYISSTDEVFGPRKPKTVRRDIVAIRFNEADAVENIETFDVQDGQVVRLTARVTDSAVSELSLLRQIFGNVGTPTAGDVLNQ